ncbi:MAG: hypothetical protein U9Q89_02385 [Thermodesulfobacteriota bacterium]|nr:hypothetical protein [Thermodesulfobacteriota bacterium]
MGTYKIKVNIELVECKEMEEEGDLIKNKNGSFSMTIREEDAVSIVVSNRQKHNGTSWSKPGSVALASVTALKRNQEYKRWFENGDLEFKLAA